jgi:tetratricopeptide (TPR) repeat protein
LNTAISLWSKDVDEQPEFGTRLEATKLFIELGEFERAVGLLEGLREEDDEVLEAWYYLGWAWYLRGQGEEGKELSEKEKGERDGCWEEAREAFVVVEKVRSLSFASYRVLSKYLTRYSFF